MLKTPICPSCGCSLVRLKIGLNSAKHTQFNGQDYYFCCQGCLDLFMSNPQFYVDEIRDMIVCPSCLAEKPKEQSVRRVINAQEVYFCRCPTCIDAFEKRPDFFIDRLDINNVVESGAGEEVLYNI